MISLSFLYTIQSKNVMPNFLKEETINSDQNKIDYQYKFNEEEKTFFEYAEERTLAMNLKSNQIKKVINSCKYAPLKLRSNKKECQEISFDLINEHEIGATKIFSIDHSKIGLISGQFKMISFFSIDTFEIKPLNRQYFTDEIPFDACTDNSKSIYIVFSAQNEIGKFILNEQNILVKIKSLIDTQFVPSAITCLKQTDEIYISEHSTNQIRIYDTDLILKQIINLNGVVYSANNALAVDKNIKLFLDGNDGVALFDTNNNNNTCHFYQNKMCIEDIDVYFDKNNKSFIYITNSCTKSIKRLVYENDKKIRIDTDFRINSGLPVNSIINSFNQMFVLTNNPSKINILNLDRCFLYF